MARLLKNVHVQSWFSYGDVDEAVSTRIVGRQGCKYGSPLFNSTFSVALVLLHDALVSAGVVTQLACDGLAVWSASPSDDASERADVLDAAFVDDAVLVLLAASPRKKCMTL